MPWRGRFGLDRPARAFTAVVVVLLVPLVSRRSITFNQRLSALSERLDAFPGQVRYRDEGERRSHVKVVPPAFI